MSWYFNTLFVLGLWLVCWGQNALPGADKLTAAQQLEREAAIRRDSTRLAKAYYLYGKVYLARSNDLKAQQYFMKTLVIRSRQGDSYEVGQVYMRMSNLEGEQDHSQKCIEYARKNLAVFERIGSDKGRMIAYIWRASKSVGQIATYP